MKCWKCGGDMPDGDKFCSVCGEKLEVKPEERGQYLSFCAKCGQRLEEDALFCENCGTPVRAQDRMLDELRTEIQNEDFKVHRKKGGSLPLLLVFLLIAILLVGGIVFAGYKLYQKYSKPEEIIEVITEIGEEVSESEEIDFSDVDIDTTIDDFCVLEGTIETMGDGTVVLSWYDEITIYGLDVVGEEVLAEDVTSVYIDDIRLEEGLIETIPSNEAVEVEGRLYIINNSIYLEAEAIYNDGEKLEVKDEKEVTLNNDYIIPHSNTVLLTNADVAGLSLQEINYAKNEIYARHGRRFKSKELQNYFDSKSWYNGTIAPENFKSSMLSSIEQKNAEFLSSVEFGMAPKGYQLDQ